MLGRPVFSWAGGMDQNHIAMTPKSEWCYRTGRDLHKLLTTYIPNAADHEIAKKAVEAYRPEAVMRVFDDVFLSGRYSAADLEVSSLFRAAREIHKRFNYMKFRWWEIT